MNTSKLNYKRKDSQRRHELLENKTLVIQKYNYFTERARAPKGRVDYARYITQYKNGTPLFGIELEIEFATNATAINKACKLFDSYVCTDGSLRDHGVEFVFAPRSENDLKQIKTQYKQGLEILSKAGALSHDSGRCGLHVHVTKSALDSRIWEELNAFLYKNKDSFLKLSRRNLDNSEQLRFCKFFPNCSGDHYAAMSFSSSFPTIEFRFFRGTLNYRSFFASIECIFSLIAYARFSKGQNMTFRGYAAFCKMNISAYPYFVIYARKMFAAFEPTIKRVGKQKLSPEEREERAAKRAAHKEAMEKKLLQISHEINDSWKHACLYGQIPSVQQITAFDGTKLAMTGNGFLHIDPQLSRLIPNLVPIRKITGLPKKYTNALIKYPRLFQLHSQPEITTYFAWNRITPTIERAKINVRFPSGVIIIGGRSRGRYYLKFQLTYAWQWLLAVKETVNGKTTISFTPDDNFTPQEAAIGAIEGYTFNSPFALMEHTFHPEGLLSTYQPPPVSLAVPVSEVIEDEEEPEDDGIRDEEQEYQEDGEDYTQCEE